MFQDGLQKDFESKVKSCLEMYKTEMKEVNIFSFKSQNT